MEKAKKRRLVTSQASLSFQRYEFTCTKKGRLDRYLASRVPHRSREKIQRDIRQGLVLINGKLAKKPSQRLQKGDQVVFFAPPPPPKFLPCRVSLKILFEDSYLLAVFKPSGMAVHPGPGHKGDTLADALLGYYLEKEGKMPEHPGIVHRLDLATSGVVIAGKSLEVQQELSRQFAERKVKKGYLALVWGHPRPAQGIISAPMEECPYDSMRWHVSPFGKKAITEYRVVERCGNFSLLQVYPLTGRTHQIRVHLTHLGHPILGDPLYGRENRHLWAGHIAPFPQRLRLCLHAERLTFDHPIRKIPLTIVSSLPEDFRKILEAAKVYQLNLKKNSASRKGEKKM